MSIDSKQNSFILLFSNKINNVVGPAITGDSEQLGVGPSQLDEDLPYKDYVDGLAGAFMDNRNNSRSKRRFGHARPK